ncbi:MAG: hypothetical protein ACKOOF_04205, partial [Planctomycetaceae bacterium]
PGPDPRGVRGPGWALFGGAGGPAPPAPPPPTTAAPSNRDPAPPGRTRWFASAGLAGLAVVIAAGGLLVGWRVTSPTRAVAESLEKAQRFAAAGDAYAAVLGDKKAELARVLWDLQTQAADAGRAADCIPLLLRLEKLYAEVPPPQIPDLSRWDVVNSLAWYLATVPGAGDASTADAERLAAEGLALVDADPALLPQALDTAAAAAARNGRFDEAVGHIERAIAAAPDAAARADFDRRRAAYRAGRAWDVP